MDARELIAAVPLVLGAVFFLAGTVGLLRFPDVYSRLHALAKADNLGLGFIVIGLLILAGSPAVGVKLLLVWALALLASASAVYVIAQHRLNEAEEERAP